MSNFKDAATRKAHPIVTGVLDYFPDALLDVAHCSKVGNDQHNPGEPLHWTRDKSTDHVDCIGRHLVQRGTKDTDGVRHSAKVAWRALAALQIEIENERLLWRDILWRETKFRGDLEGGPGRPKRIIESRQCLTPKEGK